MSKKSFYKSNHCPFSFESVLLAIVLSLAASNGFAQGRLLLEEERYSPAMDSTFELWLDMHLAKEENCKVLNPCTTSLQPEYIGIPYRLYFDNASTLNQVDSLSVINTIHSAFAPYSGYQAVPADKYDGPISDTLFVAMEVKDISYRLAMEFSIVPSLRTPYLSICAGDRSGEYYISSNYMEFFRVLSIRIYGIILWVSSVKHS